MQFAALTQLLPLSRTSTKIQHARALASGHAGAGARVVLGSFSSHSRVWNVSNLFDRANYGR
jgi:hypothetical protein